jgi:YhcH/YjgK/YiaL family protein
MIIDQFSNIRKYSTLVHQLEQGLNKYEEIKTGLEVGRYEFEGGFLMVQKGGTKPMKDGDFEAHKKYVDLQIVVSGSEEIAWCDIDNMVLSQPYSEEKDVQFFEAEEKHTMLITEGMFYIAFPHDGHKAVRHTLEPKSFTKVIIKLPV